jgi:hypothetical protein
MLHFSKLTFHAPALITGIMKKSPAGNRRSQPELSKRKARSETRVHPVVIYPFQTPADYSDLEALFELIACLDQEKSTCARPITVIDRKTHYASQADQNYLDFRKRTVNVHSDIVDAWCVDTCQMWYAGLGMACERGGPGDVYWLIPGDFNYGAAAGKQVLDGIRDLPQIPLELDHDLCIGEIEANPAASKQLIDTYGTFALLYNWFPAEAQEIRQFTERPRSEFFAIRHGFLREVLQQRWYAYEQTVVLLLRAVFTQKGISRFFVGQISDLPSGRETYASAVQQVERTERVLKALWRERNETKPGWPEQYRCLESNSDQVRKTALLILQNILA